MPHNARPARRGVGQRWQRIWRLGLLLLLTSGLGAGFIAWYRQLSTGPTHREAVAASTPMPPPSATLPLPTRVVPAPQTSRVPGAGIGTLSVHVIDVGQGDSILIQAPDGTTALIDGGYDQGLGV